MKNVIMSGVLCVTMFCNLLAQRNLVEFMPTSYDAFVYLDMKAIAEAGNLPMLKDQLKKLDDIKDNDFLSGWVSGKNTWGIDYTGTITASVYIDEESLDISFFAYIPLINEKAFTKRLKKKHSSEFKPVSISTSIGKFNLLVDDYSTGMLWNDNMLIIVGVTNLRSSYETPELITSTMRKLITQIETVNSHSLQQEPNFAQFWAQRHGHEAGLFYTTKFLKKFYAYYFSYPIDTDFANALSLFHDNTEERFIGMSLDFQTGCLKGNYEYVDNQIFINNWDKSSKPFDPVLLQYGLPNATFAATLSWNKESVKPKFENYLLMLNSLEEAMFIGTYSEIKYFLPLYDYLPNQAALTVVMDEMGNMNISIVAPNQDKKFDAQTLTEFQQYCNSERKEMKHKYDSLRQLAIEHLIIETPAAAEENEPINTDEFFVDSLPQWGEEDESFYYTRYNPEMFLTHNRMTNSDLYTIFYQYEPERGSGYSNENYKDTSLRYYISCKDDGYMLFSTNLSAIQDFDASQTTSNALFDAMGDNINRPFHFQTVKLNTLDALTQNLPICQELEELIITTTPTGMSATLNLQNKNINALEWILRQYIQMATQK